MPSCVAFNCSNRKHKGCGKTFHRFPHRNPALLTDWLVKIRRDCWVPKPCSLICSDHFEEKCFDKTGQTTRLRADAVPTIFRFPAHLIKTTKERKSPFPRDYQESEKNVLAPDTCSTNHPCSSSVPCDSTPSRPQPEKELSAPDTCSTNCLCTPSRPQPLEDITNNPQTPVKKKSSLQDHSYCVEQSPRTIKRLGNALYTPIFMVLPSIYFQRRFGLITSIMLLGASAGIMILPVITEWLVTIYNWRWALAILGALNLNTMVVGAMIQSRPQNVGRRHRGSSEKYPLLTPQQPDEPHGSPSTSQEILMDELSEGIHTDHGREKNSRFGEKCESFFTFMAKTFDITVFTTDSRFIAVAISQFFCAISYCCWIVFLIPNAESKGLDAETASLLALANGGSNALGRIGAGLVSWQCSPDPFIFFSFLSLMTAAASLGNVFASNFWQLSIAAGLAGFSGGFKVVFANVLSKEATTDNLFPAGLTWTMSIFGIGEILGECVTGAVYDHTSSYAPGFIFICVADVLSALIIILPFIIKLCG